MPVIAIVPNNYLLEKIKSNINEILARGGKLFVFADAALKMKSLPNLTVLDIPDSLPEISPIINKFAIASSFGNHLNTPKQIS